jgi:hypothetical protein
MDEQGRNEEQKRRRRKTAALLWGIAAALSVIAFVMETIDTRHVPAMKAILAGTFTLMAFATWRRSRDPKLPAS